MYLYIGLLLLLFFLFFLIFHFKKKRIIQKVQQLCDCEKIALLNDLISFAGYQYCPEEDIFTSTQDAWQREFGYSAIYDEAAPLFQMVFDCQPFYFDFQGHTWLIELWKGQYGINTGAELGIYQADTLLTPDQYRKTLFHAIPDNEMPIMQIELSKNENNLFHISNRHWWLTGFRMGTFSQPNELQLQASITFNCPEMMEAFLKSLFHQGYCKCDLNVWCQTVTIPLNSSGTTGYSQRRLLRRAISQWKNRLFVLIYNWFTGPLENTTDRLLYLYFFLPYAFRRMIQPRKRKCYRKYRRFKKRNRKNINCYDDTKL